MIARVACTPDVPVAAKTSLSLMPSFFPRLCTSLFFLRFGCINLWEVGVCPSANNRVLGFRTAGGGLGRAPAAMVGGACTSVSAGPKEEGSWLTTSDKRCLVLPGRPWHQTPTKFPFSVQSAWVWDVSSSMSVQTGAAGKRASKAWKNTRRIMWRKNRRLKKCWDCCLFLSLTTKNWDQSFAMHRQAEQKGDETASDGVVLWDPESAKQVVIELCGVTQ